MRRQSLGGWLAGALFVGGAVLLGYRRLLDAAHGECAQFGRATATTTSCYTPSVLAVLLASRAAARARARAPARRPAADSTAAVALLARLTFVTLLALALARRWCGRRTPTSIALVSAARRERLGAGRSP